jgi:hypothetical protein
VVLNQKHKAKEKGFEVELFKWQAKVQAFTAQVAGLEEDLRDARKVRASPRFVFASTLCITPSLYFSKISFAFRLPSSFHRHRGKKKRPVEKQN